MKKKNGKKRKKMEKMEKKNGKKRKKRKKILLNKYILGIHQYIKRKKNNCNSPLNFRGKD